MDMNTVSMADEYPSDGDQAVLDVLRREGRANPKLIRDETGMDKGNVNTVLVRAARHGDVQQVTRGLYEYTGGDAPSPVDRAAVAKALDDLEAAMERGDARAAQQALQRAREAVNGAE